MNSFDFQRRNLARRYFVSFLFFMFSFLSFSKGDFHAWESRSPPCPWQQPIVCRGVYSKVPARKADILFSNAPFVLLMATLYPTGCGRHSCPRRVTPSSFWGCDRSVGRSLERLLAISLDSLKLAIFIFIDHQQLILQDKLIGRCIE